MREINRLVFIYAPLGRDAEARRWYSQGADRCVVLTQRGRLLEPNEVFGPTSYRLLARRVSVHEARSWALERSFACERRLPH